MSVNQKPTLEKVMKQVEAITCLVMTWVHTFLARVIGGSLGWCWRWQGRHLTAPFKFFLGFTALAAMAYGLAWFLPERYVALAGWDLVKVRLLKVDGLWDSALATRQVMLFASGLCAVAALLSFFVRCRLTLWVMKAAWAAWIAMWFATVRWGLAAPAALNRIDYKLFDKAIRNDLWLQAFGWGFILLIIPALILMGLALSSTRRWYYRQKEETAPQDELPAGDALVESLRTGGDDPRYRSSLYWAIGLWASVLILPVLIRGCGWERGYELPFGDGGEFEPIVVTPIKPQPKPEKKFIVNAWSPYIFDRIKVDDIKVMETLMQDTRDTYVAANESTGGKPGIGGGRGGGWPHGMEGALVRFIRLQYAGGNWDLEMGRRGDYNLLIQFNKITGFPIARETESREISRLKMFPKRKAPPFVYMTGSGNVNLTESELKTLRWYLEEEGGMLIVSCGGGTFGPSVRRMFNRLLPGRPLVDISNDDPIFKAPFVFPDGAPPLWFHDGRRALGIKIDGRWAVFYHPGDMGDAWKDGHSGASKHVADQAYRLGINLMYYAFNAYYRRHYAPGEEMSK